MNVVSFRGVQMSAAAEPGYESSIIEWMLRWRWTLAAAASFALHLSVIGAYMLWAHPW